MRTPVTTYDITCDVVDPRLHGTPLRISVRATESCPICKRDVCDVHLLRVGGYVYTEFDSIAGGRLDYNNSIDKICVDCWKRVRGE